MVKHRMVSTVLAALMLAAGAGAASAAPATPAPKVTTSDTTLKIGQKVVVRLDGFDERFKSRRSPVRVQVVRIEKGKPADLKGSGLPASTTGMVPFYIRAVLSYAGADFQGSAPLFSGSFFDGSRAGAVITSRDIGPCAAGDTIKLSKQQRNGRDCTVVLAPPGVQVVAADIFVQNDKGDSFTVTWKTKKKK